MIEKLETLLTVVLEQINELYSYNPYEEDEPETTIIEHCDHLSLSKIPSITNPSYSNGENEWKALDSKLIEFHQVPERDSTLFKSFLIQSIFTILRSLLDIFGERSNVSDSDPQTHVYRIKDERIFLRLKLLIEELGLNETRLHMGRRSPSSDLYTMHWIPLLKGYTLGGPALGHNYIQVVPFTVESMQNREKTFLNCFDVEEKEEEKTKLRTISFVSYGIANGKSTTLASLDALDNEFSAFFRYQFEDGVFMLKKFYPIFVHLGLFCKAFHLIKYKSSVGIVSRNWVDHSFFAAIEGRTNYFTLKYYQHLFSHTVAARNYEFLSDIFFRMVTFTDDTFKIGAAGKVMINEDSISVQNIRFPFDYEAKKITEGRLMENKTFKTEQEFSSFMKHYRVFFEAAMRSEFTI
jgi:hypothetical protein